MEQIELLDRPRVERSKAADGMARVRNRNERENPEWESKALEALRQFAKWQGGFFTMEQARAVIAWEVPAPTDRRAWGPLTQLAIREGVIKKAPGMYAPAASSNGAPKQMYAKGAKA